MDDRLGDPDPLPETLGELAYLGLAVVAQPADVYHLSQPGADARPGHSPQRPHVFQVVGDRHVSIERHRLRQVAHPFSHFKGFFYNVESIETH